MSSYGRPVFVFGDANKLKAIASKAKAANHRVVRIVCTVSQRFQISLMFSGGAATLRVISWSLIGKFTRSVRTVATIIAPVATATSHN